MNSMCKTLTVFSIFIAAAYGLQCRQCYIGVFGTCFFPSEVTCGNATESCYKGDAQFNATGRLQLHTRGCLDSDLCGKTITGSILNAPFTSSFTCCTTDLCNSASSMHLSVVVGTVFTLLSALLVSQ